MRLAIPLLSACVLLCGILSILLLGITTKRELNLKDERFIFNSLIYLDTIPSNMEFEIWLALPDNTKKELLERALVENRLKEKKK